MDKAYKSTKRFINIPVVTVLVRIGDGMLKEEETEIHLGEIKLRVCYENMPITYLPLNFIICIFRRFFFFTNIFKENDL